MSLMNANVIEETMGLTSSLALQSLVYDEFSASIEKKRNKL